MEFNPMNSPNFSDKRQGQYRYLITNYIVRQVEKGTGLSLSALKRKYPEDRLFQVALKHVTTTKKALCSALGIPVEAGCRYKRTLEKSGLLVQSITEIICPFTKHPAHLISTNLNEFERLLKSNSNQLNLFD
jgi:hypothetical protein